MSESGARGLKSAVVHHNATPSSWRRVDGAEVMITALAIAERLANIRTCASDEGTVLHDWFFQIAALQDQDADRLIAGL